MNHIAITDRVITRWEHWHDAAQHVASATGTPREDLWFRTGHGEGLAVFQGRSNQVQPPIARILSPVEFQRAKSRGDLEGVDNFLGRAGGEHSDPALQHTAQTMSKTPIDPTVYCIVQDNFVWQGKRHRTGRF